MIERECRVFTEYLLGCAADPYVLKKYSEAHQISAVFSTGTRFDFHLVRVASAHGRLTKLADAYARIFAPSSLLRKKLVLLLAILETSTPSCHMIDAADWGSRPALLLRLLLATVSSACALLAGALVFLPARLVVHGVRRRSR